MVNNFKTYTEERGWSGWPEKDVECKKRFL